MGVIWSTGSEFSGLTGGAVVSGDASVTFSLTVSDLSMMRVRPMAPDATAIPAAVDPRRKRLLATFSGTRSLGLSTRG